MTVRTETLGAVVAIVIVGLAVGAWLAVMTRPAGLPTAAVTVAHTTKTASPAPPVAATVATPAPAATATTHAPTTAPVANTATAAASVAGTLHASWDVEEANVQVGTIVWRGDAVTQGNAMVFEGHKESVGGRLATPCERRTYVRATFVPGAAGQTVPYREINCAGTVSTGEVRVTAFAADGASFTGSFWQRGTKLGDFTARRR